MSKLIELTLINNHRFPMSVSLKSEAQAIAEKYGASKKAIKTRIQLWDTDRDRIKEIKKARTAIANAINPENNNPGLLKSQGRYVIIQKYLMPLTVKVSKAIDRYETAIADLVRNWDEEIDAAKVNCGGAFSSAYYPDPSTLVDAVRKNVYLDLTPSNLLQELDINVEGVDTEAQLRERIARLTSDVRESVTSAAEALVKGLRGTQFKRSRLTQLIAAVDSLQELVPAGTSPDLDYAGNRLRQLVEDTPENYWSQPNIRTQVADEVEKVTKGLLI